LIILLTLIIINLFCLRINLNADTLFPYRYIEIIQSGNPFLLFIQPGSRIFPEWLYSYIAYFFTQEPIPWSRFVIAINTLMLVSSLHFFFTKLEFHPFEKGFWIAFMVLILPVLYLVHQNVLIYFIFSPGVHGFYIPYMFFNLGAYFQFINKNVLSRLLIVLIFISNSILVSSNLNFVIMAIAPIIAISFCLTTLGTIKLKQFLQVTGFGVMIIIAGLLIAAIFHNLFEQIHFTSNNFEYFKHDLVNWFKQNDLLQDIHNRKTSGYWLEITYLTIISSLWSIFTNSTRKLTPAIILNLFFLFGLFIFISVAWVIDKGSIRLMPQLILLSPFLLAFNIMSVFIASQKNHILFFSISFICVAALSTFTFYSSNRPYIQHQFIHDKVNELKTKNIIKADGFSNYWIAHTNYEKNINILPLSSNLTPYIFATDANKFWQFTQNKLKSQRSFDFIINDKRLNAQKWTFNESILINTLGQYDQVMNYQFKNRAYKIYIYNNEIKSNKLYKKLNNDLSGIN